MVLCTTIVVLRRSFIDALRVPKGTTREFLVNAALNIRLEYSPMRGFLILRFERKAPTFVIGHRFVSCQLLQYGLPRYTFLCSLCALAHFTHSLCVRRKPVSRSLRPSSRHLNNPRTILRRFVPSPLQRIGALI